jgi:hypothetical protein
MSTLKSSYLTCCPTTVLAREKSGPVDFIATVLAAAALSGRVDKFKAMSLPSEKPGPVDLIAAVLAAAAHSEHTDEFSGGYAEAGNGSGRDINGALIKRVVNLIWRLLTFW